ncbi:MAG: hypothetical protein H6704_26125 [Myxococcales bacterium]|nr:hypothetical protein [Myxococcales bacterium]MCB9539705.1 hypothetical protein [Myxococcales bacterium]
MKIDVVTHCPFPLADVFEAMRDQLPALAEYMPNIASIEVKSREELDDGEVKLVNRWQAAQTEVPAAARPFVKPEQLYWLDHAHWMPGQMRCDWRLEMAFMTERIDCRGSTTYHEVKDGGTETRIVGELKLDLKGLVPRLMVNKVTGMVEDFVGRMIQPNFQKTTDALTAYLESKKA